MDMVSVPFFVPVGFVPDNSWEQKERDKIQKIKAMKLPYQESRRNLTPYQRTEIMLQFKPILAAKAKVKESTKKSTPANSPESSKEIDTRCRGLEVPEGLAEQFV